MYDYNYGYDYINPGLGSSGFDTGASTDILQDILGVVAFFGITLILISLVVAILL